MRNLLFSFVLLSLLSSCGNKDYPYAEKILDCYEETIDKYEEAESLEELDDLRTEAIQAIRNIEKEEEESQKELVRDIEKFDENAYLNHLDILTAQSHTQWIYLKMRKQLEEKKN